MQIEKRFDVVSIKLQGSKNTTAMIVTKIVSVSLFKTTNSKRAHSHLKWKHNSQFHHDHHQRLKQPKQPTVTHNSTHPLGFSLHNVSGGRRSVGFVGEKGGDCGRHGGWVGSRASERETGYEKEAADAACFSVTRTRRRWG